MDNLKRELDARASNGQTPIAIACIEARLNSIGFKLDRSEDCTHVARWMSGDQAGQSYPAISTGVKHIESGIGAYNVALPKGARLNELQAMRATGELFAVINNAIFEV